ncbi:uncharacterized protein LOC128209039 isoform X1 [Mya arenaria]|uniref:uncharacterized protein LOC128209039 isoform X1 n=1 Tax=Mya arenaria TaxID=6604 RepID=UPI0022E81174|nr:uncharacterized protein LOC128209039 isoform X1 [Mya arenaria]
MLTQIKDLRDTLNQLLDQLEKGTKEEMNNVLGDLDGSLQRDIESCTHMHDQLKALMDKIQDSGEDNEPNSHIGHRNCIEKIREANYLLHGMLHKPEMKVSFQADTLAREVLSQLKTLRTIQKVQSVQSILRAIQIDKHNIKHKTDKSDCGIAELPNEEILLVDITNSKVKTLNRKYKMTTHIDLPQNPHDICHISGKGLAVSVNSPDNRHEVYFLVVKASKIKMNRKFSVDHYCYSIRHHQGKLYVASATALYLYTTSGQLEKKIYEDPSSGCTVKRFALAGDGRKIYIAASDHHKLITIDNKGNILSTLQDQDIKSPVGVYVNEDGHVFVCSYRSCTVIQVDQEGRKKLATLVREEDGMNYPQAVCYGTRMRRLIVGGEQDDVLVAHLQ